MLLEAEVTVGMDALVCKDVPARVPMKAYEITHAIMQIRYKTKKTDVFHVINVAIISFPFERIVIEKLVYKYGHL